MADLNTTRIFGDLYTSGTASARSFNTTSYKNYKRIIRDVNVTQEQLNSLRLVEFEWIGGHNKGNFDSGIIAQDVQKVFPHCVTRIKGVLTVDYGKLAVHIALSQMKLNNENKSIK